MGSKSGFSQWAAGLGFGVLLVQASACGMTVKRDLSASKPGVVVFDDMCGLQNYFDALHDSTIATPREVFAQDLADENGKATGGTARYRFETEFQLHHLRQLLTTNWGGLPDEVGKASALDLEVRWSEKATVKRVVTTEPAVLSAGDKKWDLPYHVCLSDLVVRRAALRHAAHGAELAVATAQSLLEQTTGGADGCPDRAGGRARPRRQGK